MRLFLANFLEKQTDWLRTALKKAYGPELPIIAHTPALAWENLPAHCLVESTERATAALLNQLHQHGFKIVIGVSNPLNAFAAQLSSTDINSSADNNNNAAAAREHVLRNLEWSHVDGALVLRQEDWALSRDTEIERLRHHCGEFTGAQSAAVALAHAHAHDSLAPHEAPDFWRTRISFELALKIHEAHAGLFAALGYAPPNPRANTHTSPNAEDGTSAAAISSNETLQLRDQLRALEINHARLKKDSAALRRYRAKSVAEVHSLENWITASEAGVSRYHHLVHGVGVGKHLHRAWRVLIGDRHYRQKPPAPKPVVTSGPRPLPDHLKGYESLTFGDLEVRIHLEALHDNRGTGRVATQLLNGLKALQTPRTSSSGSAPRVVHFFTAPLWGPDELPPRTCMLIHDVIPSIVPDFAKESLAVFEKRCKSALRQSDKIITISATSARDISAVFGYPENKIRVIHNGVTRLPVAENPITKLPAVPFVAYVGAGDTHKNLGILFDALRLPAASHVHLVMVGDNAYRKNEFMAAGLEDRVHFLGRLDDAEVGHVLQRASAFVFPSYYEGFGLPPLEAALLGTPSICSRRPAMTELLADAAIFADHESPEDWSACMHLMTTRPDFAREIGELAKIKAERLQWDATCRAYLEELKAMA